MLHFDEILNIERVLTAKPGVPSVSSLSEKIIMTK